MKRTIEIEGWKVQLRVRVQRKKKKVKGRTRGRYEGKTAHLVLRAPGGETAELYIGSGLHLAAGIRNRGEESTRGAQLEQLDERGGRKRGTKAPITDRERKAAAAIASKVRFSEGPVASEPWHWTHRKRR